jgi:predicted membrane protein
MINPYSFVFLAVLMLIISTSPAQIRYALSNPFTSITVFLNIAIILAMVGLFLHYKSRNKKASQEEYQLVGSKGGKAEKNNEDSQGDLTDDQK